MKVKIFLVVALVIALIAIVVLVISLNRRDNTSLKVLNNLVETKTTLITSDTVIDRIEQVSELTTTKYTIQLVAKSETVGGWFLLGTTNVKMLLIAKGTVRAGLDLAQLDASDVIVSDDGKSVSVYLPQVKIFDRDQILNSNPSDTYVLTFKKVLLPTLRLRKPNCAD